MRLKPKRKYDQNFKKNAVLLCAELGRAGIQVGQEGIRDRYDPVQSQEGW